MSDQFSTQAPLGLPGLIIAFSSDGETNRPCSSVAGCALIEDGTVQIAFTATWNLSAGAPIVDTIQFQSDLDTPAGGIPEPSSIVLALTGFGLFGIGLHRRRAPGSNI